MLSSIERPSKNIEEDGDILEDEEKKEADDSGPVLYVAPTGKAAAVMKNRCNKKAYTAHSVIASYKAFKFQQKEKELERERELESADCKIGNQKQSEAPTNWKFSSKSILVIDESSMVSLEVQ